MPFVVKVLEVKGDDLLNRSDGYIQDRRVRRGLREVEGKDVSRGRVGYGA